VAAPANVPIRRSARNAATTAQSLYEPPPQLGLSPSEVERAEAAEQSQGQSRPGWLSMVASGAAALGHGAVALVNRSRVSPTPVVDNSANNNTLQTAIVIDQSQELRQVQDPLASVTAQHHATIARLEGEKTQLQRQVDILQEQLRTAQSDRDALQSELAATRQQLLRVTAEHAIAHQALQQHQAESFLAYASSVATTNRLQPQRLQNNNVRLLALVYATSA